MENQAKKRKVVLEDGSVFQGTGFGSMDTKKVELVFNTSMVGYQEILSDPSYTDQAVVMTYPLIGNYGMCAEDYETNIPSISGMVVREYCDSPSNFRGDKTLSSVMETYGIAGVEGIDTRMLTRHIRNYGSCKAYIVDDEYPTDQAVKELKEWIPATDQVSRVSTKEIYKFDEPVEGAKEAKYHVVAIDCGIKKNILRSMKKKGIEVTVVPFDTTSEKILSLKPDGVFISNGPGDPVDVKETIKAIRELIGRLPIFGICLGHQIISLAYGAKTYKLRFGHRGGNHPVKNLKNGLVEITSQNHSYVVDTDTLNGTGLVATHINLLDNTIEGVENTKDKIFSVQYHPESAPGPQDSDYLFDEFILRINEWKEEHKDA